MGTSCTDVQEYTYSTIQAPCSAHKQSRRDDKTRIGLAMNIYPSFSGPHVSAAAWAKIVLEVILRPNSFAMRTFRFSSEVFPPPQHHLANIGDGDFKILRFYAIFAYRLSNNQSRTWPLNPVALFANRNFSATHRAIIPARFTHLKTSFPVLPSSLCMQGK